MSERDDGAPASDTEFHPVQKGRHWESGAVCMDDGLIGCEQQLDAAIAQQEGKP